MKRYIPSTLYGQTSDDIQQHTAIHVLNEIKSLYFNTDTILQKTLQKSTVLVVV